MLIGLIMYISIFKAEIGSKLRSRYPQQPPMFEFTYGESFFLYVIGFISTEFVGVLNVFLFISLQQIGREKVKKKKENCFFPHSIFVCIVYIFLSFIIMITQK